jgi:hypothetical protein
MTFLLGIDDTDNLQSRGTGRLARSIASALADHYPVSGVTRHQLYVHPDIPFTSHNSCAVIHIETSAAGAEADIFSFARSMMMDDFVEGSDPGIAGAPGEKLSPAVVAFGRDAKQTVLTQQHARGLAKNCDIRLEGLGGTEDGVIGAMAGLGLARAGNDGRFLMAGTIRACRGTCTTEELFAAGIDEIWTLDGKPVEKGYISSPEGKSVKPCPVNGRIVLFVRETGSTYQAVKRD